jgi:CheY-like chemotaxis protein
MAEFICSYCSKPIGPGEATEAPGGPAHLWCKTREACLDALKQHERARELQERAGELVEEARLRMAARHGMPVILVVDDEPDMRENMVRILRRGPYACVTAGDGQEALALLEREAPPDLILTDLRMAGMDGLAFLREARRIVPEVPVVLVTGYVAEESVRDAVRDGAVPLLAKPFSAAELLGAVRAALKGRGDRRRPRD